MTPRLPRPWPLAWLTLGALLLAFLGLEIAGWPFLREPLERRLAQQLQRDVSLQGRFRLNLLGAIRVRVESLVIAAPAWEAAAAGSAVPPFVQARNAHLVLPYGTLVSQLRRNGEPLRIHRLEVEDIDARLRRLADGRANWRFPRRTEGGDAPGDKGGASPEFVHLIVHKGTLLLDDATTRLALRAMVRTREGSARDAAGLFVRARGHYRGQAFTAEARSPGILPLVAPRGKTAPVALAFSARLGHSGQRDSEFRFRGRARDLLRFEGLDGDFRVAGPSLAAAGQVLRVTLPSTAAFFMQGRIGKEGDLWEVDVTRFEVGRTRLAGRFRHDSTLAPPRLAGELRGRQLVLADLAPALGASPPPPGADAADADTPGDAPSPRGKVLPQREFDIPALHRMDADVDIRVDRVDLGSERLEPLQPLEARLSLQRGVLRIDQLLARTASGALQGELTLDARADTPVWTGDLRWSGIDLARWIRQRNRFARDEGAAGKAPGFLTGELAGQARVEGRGRSTAAMLGSLDGRVDLWVRRGTVSQLLLEAMGLDIAEGLGLVIRGDLNLPLRCAALSLQASDGVLATRAGVVDTPDTLLLLSGKVSLADENFRLQVEARPHDRSPLSLRSPLRLTGSFADPRVRPDLQKVGAKAVLATVMGTLLAPLAALVPLVDTGEPARGEGCAATLARLEKRPGTPPAMKRALGKKQRPAD